MEPESRKRRISNFDVSPEQLSTPSLISSYLAQQQVPTLQFGPNGIYSLDMYTGSRESTVGSIYTERLEKAMERNFDYILRMESQIQEAKANMAAFSSISQMKHHALLSAAGVSTAAGIGAAKLIAQMNQQMAKHQQESVSVYVSNLPLDITEEELAPGPRVKQPVKPLKRIRLYTDSVTGKKKGDALLTFSKPEYAKNAVSKYNEMDIGDGFVIKVVRADFQQSGNSRGEHGGDGDEKGEDTDWDDSNRPAPPPSASSAGTAATSSSSDVKLLSELRNFSTSSSSASQSSSSSSSSSSTAPTASAVTGPDLALLAALLPPECEASTHPVVVLLNLYTNTSLSDFIKSYSGSGSLEDAVTKFYDDLEADMLVECCSFGRIHFLQVLDLAEEMMTQWGGGVVVSFDTVAAARVCAETFRRRRVEGKAVVAVVLEPTSGSGGNNSGAIGEAVTAKSECEVKDVGVPPGGYTPLDKLPAHIPPPPPPPIRFVRPTATTETPSPPAPDVQLADTSVAPVVADEPTGDDLDVDNFLNSLL